MDHGWHRQFGSSMSAKSQQQRTISAVARQVCLQPHSGSQYASLASASRRISSVDFPLYMLPVSVERS